MLKIHKRKTIYLMLLKLFQVFKRKLIGRFAWISDKDSTFGTRVVAFAAVEEIFFQDHFEHYFLAQRNAA